MKKLVLAALMLGCGGEDAQPADGPPGFRPLSPPEYGVQIETPEFEVEAYGDVEYCYYTPYRIEEDVPIKAVVGQQMEHGHHLVVYGANVPLPTNLHPCLGFEMTNFAYIGAGGGAEAISSAQFLPPGAGTVAHAGLQLVINSHYINYEDHPILVKDQANIVFAQEGEVRAEVNLIVFGPDDLDIPPGEPTEAGLTCEVGRDFHVASVLGHTHRMGKHVTLTHESGGQERVIYDEETRPGFALNPPVDTFSLDEPFELRAGDRLGVTCAWDNTTDEMLHFPGEMCFGVMFYWPDDGLIYCGHDGDTLE